VRQNIGRKDKEPVSRCANMELETRPGLSRRDEERLVRLCAKGDFRPSRWARAGNAELLAGVAMMLASERGAPRARLLSLAERLSPGMSEAERFGLWLERAPIDASRFFALLAAQRQTDTQKPG
jgi:hypothetical protein